MVAPNMQPGGYNGEFNRDYTYGLTHAPWWLPTSQTNAWNLTLDNFLWASEQLMLGQRAADGQMPDVVYTAGGAGGVNRCSDQYCTFPAGSPLPRPSCCGGSSTHPFNCSDGSMDSAPFAVFNVLFLAERTKEARGDVAASAWLARWLPHLLNALARVPASDGGAYGSLAFNDPHNPIVGYGFEDSVAKTGYLNFASLLTLEACALLCNAARRYAHSNASLAVYKAQTEALCIRAANMSTELSPALWVTEVGMFRPSTGLEGNLTDVWGSAYAASLDGVHTFLGNRSSYWPSDVPLPTTSTWRLCVEAHVCVVRCNETPVETPA